MRRGSVARRRSVLVLLLTVAGLLPLLLWAGLGRAQIICDKGCLSSTTFNPAGPATGSFWVAKTNNNNTISVYVNGSLLSPQPGGAAIGPPVLSLLMVE
jgi:hypothetical protein